MSNLLNLDIEGTTVAARNLAFSVVGIKIPLLENTDHEFSKITSHSK
jgi:hypothetical protein